MLTAMLLSSCKLFSKDKGNEGGSDNGTGEATAGVIYDSKTNVSFIVNDQTLETNLVYYIVDEVGKVTPSAPTVSTDSAERASREIVIGESNRDVTRKAYIALDRIEKESDKEVGYVVFTDGSSIAIVYEQDRYGIHAAANTAIKSFTDEMLAGKASFSHAAGVILSGSINPLDYQAILDEETTAKNWSNILIRLQANPNVSDELALEIVDALKYYNSIFNDEVNSWLANLYDPGVGGFYYSNSGRDTEGFLPDIESTQQALGMVESYGIAIPDWMKKQVSTWAKGLQDPNGYFYHPQWSKTETEQHPSRMGRDLERGLYLVSLGGLSPTYDTILGNKGDGLLPDGTPVSTVSPTALTGRLGSSAVSAASRVVPVNAGQGSVPTRFLNKENFLAYLSTLDINGNSYPVGNELASQASQIKARDKQLKAEGANYSLKDILVNWLNEHQNPETGVWTIGKGIDFEGVNGLLKIIALYDGLEAEFPHPIEAAKSAFAVIGNGEELGSVCYLYNVWYAIGLVMDNISKYSTDKINLQKQMDEFRAEILQDAPRAIRETANGVNLFQKPDGSFSFTQTYSAATSQGMRVCLQYQYEGDVNATTICSNGTANHMYKVLGLPRVKQYTRADALELLEMFEDLQPVIKDEEIIDNRPIDFSDDTLGARPQSVGATINSSGDAIITRDDKYKEHGKYLELRSDSDGGDYITVSPNTSRLGSSCLVFEGDLCYTEDCPDGYYSQVYMNLYIYMLAMKIQDGRVHIWDSSSQGGSRVEQDLGYSIPLGEWFKLRIEYYSGDAETVRIKVYINGELIAVSDNYYDSTGMKVYPEGAAPQNYYNYVMINIFSTARGTILLDNLLSTKTNAVYEPTTDPIKVNADALPEDEKIYSFEDDLYGEIEINEGSDTVIVTEKDGNSVLSLNTVKNGGSSVTLPVTNRVRRGNCGVFEADILLEDAPIGTIYELAFVEDSSNRAALMKFHLIVVESDGAKFATLAEAPTGTTGKLLTDAKLPIGEWTTLRIEFYTANQAALIYIDGTLYASSDYTCSNSRYYTYGLFTITNKSTATATVYMDDLKAETITKSFDQATQPSVDRVTYEFDSGLGEGVTADSGITASGGTLSFNKANSGASILFPNNKRSVVASAAIFEIKVNHLASAKAGNLYEMALVGEDGKVIAAIVVKKSGDSFGIYEKTENNTYNSPIITFSAGVETIAIEYYKDKNTLNIYAGGSLIGATCLTYSADSASLSYTYGRIKKLSSDNSFTIDYAFAESYNKFYESAPVTVITDEGTLDFEEAFTSKIPSSLTKSFKSSMAALRIEEAIIGGIASKALAFDSSSGANDNLTFNMTANADKYNVFVYETDICFNFKDGDKALQIYLEAGSSRSYMLNVSCSKDGKVAMYDLSAPSGGKAGKSIQIAENGEWIKLRIEYYGGQSFDDTRAKTYVNGELVYVSNNFYNCQKEGATPFNGATGVRYYTYGGCVSTLLFDNVSVERKTLDCADDELTVDMKPTPKPEEPPVVVDPDAGKLPGKYYAGLGSPLYTYDTIDAVWNGLYNNGKGIYHINYNSSGTGLGVEFEENGQRTYAYLDSMKGKNGYTTNVIAYGKNDICNAKGHLAFPETYAPEDGNVFVFETDLYVNSAALDAENPGDGTVLLIRFAAGNFVNLVGTNSDTALYDLALRLVDGKLLFDGSTTEIETGKWFNIAIEVYFTEGYLKIYLDGVCIGTNDITANGKANLAGVQLQLFENVKPAKYFIDNTFVGTVHKDGIKAATPEVETGNRDGGKYFKQNGGYNFNAMSSVWSNLDTKEIIDRNTDSTTADASTGAFLRFEDLFYDRSLVFGKVAADRIAEFYFKKSQGTGAGVVFETAMRLTEPAGSNLSGKEIFAIGFTSGMRNSGAASNILYFNNRLSFVYNGDGTYTIGNTTVNCDVWFNLSVEYFDGTVSVYVNGTLAASASGEIAPEEITHMGFYALKETNDVRMYLDNLYFGTTDKIQ